LALFQVPAREFEQAVQVMLTPEQLSHPVFAELVSVMREVRFGVHPSREELEATFRFPPVRERLVRLSGVVKR